MVLENETEHYFHHAIAKHSAQYNVISKKSNFPKAGKGSPLSEHFKLESIRKRHLFKKICY